MYQQNNSQTFKEVSQNTLEMLHTQAQHSHMQTHQTCCNLLMGSIVPQVLFFEIFTK